MGRLFSPRRRALRALIAKELHFQHNSLILFVIFALLQTLALLYIELAHPRNPEPYFTVPLFIYAAVMPLVIGSSAIAQERNLGTRAWHLTVPASARLQWFVKLTVVVLFTAIFGIGVPLLWLAVHVPQSELPEALAILLLFCPSVLLVTLIAFYASSFSRDTTRALLASVGLIIALTFTGTWLAVTTEKFPLIGGDSTLSLYTPAMARVFANGWYALGLPLLCLSILLLIGSFKHFRTLDHSGARICSNLLLVFLPPLFLFYLLFNLAIAATRLSMDLTSTHPGTNSSIHSSAPTCLGSRSWLGI